MDDIAAIEQAEAIIRRDHQALFGYDKDVNSHHLFVCLRSFFMRNDTILKTGIIGTAITALCCFTPVLVILLGAVGLSAILGYLDIVLLPALGIFVMMTLYALWKRRMA